MQQNKPKPYGPVGIKKVVTFSAKTEGELSAKLDAYNAKADDSTKITLTQIKAVYRRGASVFAVSTKAGSTLDKSAMNRVDAYLRLLASGRPSNPGYTDDFDLLPAGHQLSTTGLIASAVPERDVFVELKHEHEYESAEHAIITMAELSGQGYEIVPALRAAWIRAVRDKEEPFTRAAVLASALYRSKDADLLPKKEGL